MPNPGSDSVIGNMPRPVLTVVAILIVLSLACGPCGSLSRAVPTPPHDISLSADLAGRLDARLQQSLRGAPGQSFILSITDSEVSSLVSSELAPYGKASALQNPIIWFTGGKIHGTGRLVHVLPVESDFYLVAKASAVDGKIIIEIEQALVGSMALSESVLALISRSISETIDEQQLGIVVTRLELLEGEAIIHGRRQ